MSSMEIELEVLINFEPSRAREQAVAGIRRRKARSFTVAARIRGNLYQY